MSTCISQADKPGAVSGIRFKRHNIDPKTNLCKRCKKSRFVKIKKEAQ